MRPPLLLSSLALGGIEVIRGSLRDLGSFPLRRPVLTALSLAFAAAIPVFFTLHTKLVWDDFLITYRYSENLARGHGAVYSSGERVYGFTSPLNMLIPAIFAALIQARDFLAPLWFYRIVSLACLLFGIVVSTNLLAGKTGSSGARLLAAAVFPVVALLEMKTTAFAMSGQEVGLMIGFFVSALAVAYLGWAQRYLLGGLLWAGLMYSRPDGCIYIAAVAAVALAFEPGPKKPIFIALGKSALICGLLYLPWFLFTWGYYGSPVPHTLIAKHGLRAFHSDAVGLLAPVYGAFSVAPSLLCLILGPIYDPLIAAPTSWPKWLHDVLAVLELVAIFYWLLPRGDRLARFFSAASFLIFCYLAYACSIAGFAPWYLAPLAFTSLLTLVSVAAHFGERGKKRPARIASVGLLLSGLLFVLGFIFCLSLRPLTAKQQVIEWGQRRLIGLWLKDHVPGDEAVYLEPLGYIGYFSQRKMVDWPGLVSPEVVAARRTLTGEGESTWADVAEAIKPKWIVARLSELRLMQAHEFLRTNYIQRKVFDVRDQLGAMGDHYGMSLLYSDATYCILSRKE